MASKRGLGKGLSALLPDNIEDFKLDDKKDAPSRGGELLVSLDKLSPNPAQPRKDFKNEEMEELAESIRQQGIIQPIIAEDSGGGNYTIVSGERRARAARLAGLSEVPVVLRKYSEEKRMEVSLVENIQREDLNPIEEAAAYRQIMQTEGLSQDDLAKKVGKNRATVANSLRLLKLPAEMQESLRKAELSPGHARALLSVTNPVARENLFLEIVKKGLSVREAEKKAAVSGGTKAQKQKKKKGRAPELEAMEEKFITRLGTKVKIDGDFNKGTVLIDYYSMEDLDRLYNILGGSK
ncbi:MAG: ParB/RepB/Spo0J family partition protein [Treponema sp.]|nr:ParB/RepB/Spo0J family partition protein [Treponema sp.]